jgi:hypothetical protein
VINAMGTQNACASIVPMVNIALCIFAKIAVKNFGKTMINTGDMNKKLEK